MSKKKQFGPDGLCLVCGKAHPHCWGHRKGTNKTEPCMRPPGMGPVCVNHGGRAPLARRKVAEEVQRQELEYAVTRFAVRKDLSPEDALLDLVQYQAGVVDFWRQEVEKVPRDQLTWGVLKRIDKTGGLWDELTETTGAAVDLTYQLLREAQQDLSTYAQACIRAGIEDRKVRIAEQQGELFAAGQRRILTSMFEEMANLLRANGVTDEDILATLRKGWLLAQQVVVPREMRALAAHTKAREELL